MPAFEAIRYKDFTIRGQAFPPGGRVRRMADASTPPTSQDAEPAHLRTVAFRMREIQRLLAVRVEQENRRLAADGLEPVAQHRFVEGAPGEE